MEISDRRIETDVLVIGGGLAGCMASIKATEENVKVAIAEKANTLRSGCAATGISHYWVHIPEIHDSLFSAEDLVSDLTNAVEGIADKKLLRVMVQESYDRLLDLEKYGQKIRDEKGNLDLMTKLGVKTETWRMIGIPTVHFYGRDLKVRLTEEALRRGVKIYNRIMVTNLMTEGNSVIGAVGINVRNGDFWIFKSKATVLATGCVNRLYKQPFGSPFSSWFPPSCTGDGHTMALRAGAGLINMEFPKKFPHIIGLDKSGGITEFYPTGRMVNAKGDIFMLKGRYYMGYADAVTKEIEEGRGPVFIICPGSTDEDIDYMLHSIMNETGGYAVVQYFQEKGIDLKKDKVELSLYEPIHFDGHNGVVVDTEGRTCLKGLFAAGDVMGGAPYGNATGAFVIGARAGKAAAKCSLKAAEPRIDESQVESEKERVYAPLKRKEGVTWQELQLAMQNIMTYYTDGIRTEAMLKTALERLMGLRDEMFPKLYAKDAHELKRTLEVMNLMDIAEVVIAAALERKESRLVPFHYRADYPEKDDKEWRAFLEARLEEGKLKLAKKPIG